MIARVQRIAARNSRDDDPTPEQIRRMCAAIQKRWSARERRQRLGIPAVAKAWTPPVIAVGACADRRTIEDVIATDQ